MARALGRDHEDVHIGRRRDELEMNVEAVAEGEVVALAQRGRNLFLVDVGAGLIGHQHHDHVGLPGGLGGVEHRKSLFGGLLTRRAFRIESHPHIHPAVAQVERVRMALAAESDHGNFLVAQRVGIRVAVVIDFHFGALLMS
jgi:hypothetical protein